MTPTPIARREFFRLVGAGALLGTFGAGTAAATPGEYIVGTRSRAAVRAARAEAGAVKRVLDFGPFGGAVAGRFSEQALRALARRPDVSYVEPDGRMYAIAIDSADNEVPWGVDRVDAELSHVDGHTGAGMRVAVVDTGIDYDHPDLAANVAGGISYTVSSRGRWGSSESTDPADWNDGNGHGTHCAGTVAAVDNGSQVVGVAPGASLYGVKVLTDSGSGSWSDVAAGIEWAADNGMDVASMSLGGGYSDTVETACRYAADRGVVLVAAAGNDGDGSGTDGTADTHWPGASAYTIAVGATDSTDSMAWFSSTGNAVDMVAPGVDVPSTWYGGGTNTISGTSMACPHVSGAVALLLAADSSLDTGDQNTLEAVRSQLTTTTQDLGHTAYEQGAGQVYVPYLLAGTSVEEPVDGTTLEPPAGLSVTDTTADSVSLAWTASTSTGVTGYRVYRGPTFVGETGGTTFTDTGLTAETQYTYGVSAFDGSGNESDTATVTAETAPATSGGSAPTASVTGFTEGRPKGPHATFTVDWSAADVDGDLAAVSVTLRDDTGGHDEGQVTVDVSGGSASGSVELKATKDDGSRHGYTAIVTATDAAGATSTATDAATEQ